MKWRLTAGLVVLSSFPSVFAATSPASDLAAAADTYLQRAIEEHRIPALSAGIAVDGAIVWTGAAGFADIDKERAVTPETPFRVASITKVMTAVAVLQLAEKGLIDLQASVQTYLPDYPPPRKGRMTLLDLLAHTSGIRHSKGNESRRSVRHYDSMLEACGFFMDRKLAFAPGTKYRYSSYAYTVLGAILEAVTQDSFENYMSRNIWKPSGMSHTRLDRRPDQSDGAAALYRLEGGDVVPDFANDLSLIYPAGGVVSTPEDLLRFTLALERGDLLSESSRARMLEPPSRGVKILEEHGGLGWNVWRHEEHGLILSRVGGQSGASALLVSYADKGVTVALVANMARLDPIWVLTNDLIGMGMSARDKGPAARAPSDPLQ